MRRTNKKIKQKNKRTRKNYFIGGIPEEQLQYYRDFMAIKSDATAILHESREVREICVNMCRQLTHDICMTKNPVFNYIKNNVVPEMFATSQTDPTPNMEKIEDFIRKEYNNDEQYQSALNAFVNIHRLDGYSPNENDIQNYSFIFYRFYLKGGSAFVLMVQLYNHLISTDPTIKKKKTISEDEMIKILGKSSDYDFNFLINRRISKKHFDNLTILSSVLIANLLKNLIYNFSREMFNNDEIINNFKQSLLRNKTPLHADDTPLTEILKVRPSFTEYASKFDFNELITERNDATNNKLGQVSITALDIDNQAYQGSGRKNAIFILVRLMTFFKNNLNTRLYSQICGELIDVSIPLYDGYERNVKWIEESNTLIEINGIYCYNLNVMVKDLKRMIFEDDKNGNPTKIQKRENRLSFFNNLICILPKILFPSETLLYKNTGLYDTHGNCKNVLDKLFVDKKFFDKRPKLMNDLKNIMEGIYLNFPDTINYQNLNMYVLLKQYFYYYLFIYVQKSTVYLRSISTENSTYTSFEKNTNISCEYIYKNPNVNYYNCLIKNGRSRYYCLDNINNHIYNKIFECIDHLNRKKVPENILSTCIKLFNSIIYSITDNSMLQFEALSNFIRFLIIVNNTGIVNDTGYLTPNQHLINFRQYIINLTKEYNKLLSTIIDGNIFKKNIIYYTLRMVNHRENDNFIKLYLHGNYAYQLHYMLIYFFNHSKLPSDLDINDFLHKNDFFLDDFSFKLVLPNIDEDTFKENVYKIYDYYYNSFDHIFHTLELDYPTKIYFNLIKDEKSYKITGKIDVIYQVNDSQDDYDIINGEFNDMMILIYGPARFKEFGEEKHRILSCTFCNIEITMENDEVTKLNTQKINDIIDDANYLNKDYKKIFFNNYQAFVGGENIYNNVFIEPLYHIIYSYNEIINDVELDIIAKHKYIYKLLNLGL
jgi:hypothetical protein